MDALSLLEMASKASADQAFSRGTIAPEMLQRIAQEQSDLMNSRAAQEERPVINSVTNTDYGDMSFSEAFAKNRSEGKKVFSWRGKMYNTKLAEETQVPKSVKVTSPGASPSSVDFGDVGSGGMTDMQYDFSGVGGGVTTQTPQRQSDTYNQPKYSGPPYYAPLQTAVAAPLNTLPVPEDVLEREGIGNAYSGGVLATNIAGGIASIPSILKIGAMNVPRTIVSGGREIASRAAMANSLEQAELAARVASMSKSTAAAKTAAQITSNLRRTDPLMELWKASVNY